jgi:hypothetical protein
MRNLYIHEHPTRPLSGNTPSFSLRQFDLFGSDFTSEYSGETYLVIAARQAPSLQLLRLGGSTPRKFLTLVQGFAHLRILDLSRLISIASVAMTSFARPVRWVDGIVCAYLLIFSVSHHNSLLSYY